MTADPLPDEPRTELGYARRLIHVYGDRLRYVPAWRRWLVWDGQRWAHDATGQAARWMKVDRPPAHHRRPGDRGRQGTQGRAQPGPPRRILRRGRRRAHPGQHRGRASSSPPTTSTPTRSCSTAATASLDLRTGELRAARPGRPADQDDRRRLRPRRRRARVRQVPRARPARPGRCAPTWPGCSATPWRAAWSPTSCRSSTATGANGKGTLIDAVLAALGDYADAADPDLLTARTFDAHPTGVADLFGLRLAVLHETDAGRRLAEGTVKRLTGGDRLKARRMREDFWSFDPSPHLRHADQPQADRQRHRRGHLAAAAAGPLGRGHPRRRARRGTRRQARRSSWTPCSPGSSPATATGASTASPTPARSPRPPPPTATNPTPLGRFIDQRCLTGPALSRPVLRPVRRLGQVVRRRRRGPRHPDRLRRHPAEQGLRQDQGPHRPHALARHRPA